MRIFIVGGIAILRMRFSYRANARLPCVQPRLIIHKGRKKQGGNCLLRLNVVTLLIALDYKGLISCNEVNCS